MTTDHLAWIDALDQTINRSAGVNLTEKLTENGHVVLTGIQVGKPSCQVVMIDAVEVRSDIRFSRELELSGSFRSCFLEFAIIIGGRCEESSRKSISEAPSRRGS